MRFDLVLRWASESSSGGSPSAGLSAASWVSGPLLELALAGLSESIGGLNIMI